MKRRCSKCGHEKVLTEFYIDRSNKSNLRCQCIKCCQKIGREYRKQHKAEKRDKAQQYYEDHQAERREYGRRYAKDHKEERRKYNRQYHKDHGKELRECKIARGKKDRSELRRYIVKAFIQRKYAIPYEDISENMIDKEREVIRINRLLKEKHNANTKKTKRE